MIFLSRFIFIIFVLIAGCNQEQPIRTYTDDQGVKHEVVREGGGFGERLAQTAVAGVVGGAAAGVGHRVADHAINKFQERRAVRKRAKRMFGHRR